MDWANETWVKLYRRDTADWMLLSWRARGLFCLLLRAVNRRGELDLGRTGPRAVAALVYAGGDVDAVVAALSALALVVAALWLQHCCKSPGEPTGIEDAVGDAVGD